MKNKIFQKKRKKAWVRVIEAFLALLLIMAVVLIIISSQNDNKKSEISSKIYQEELMVLREIEMDQSLKEIVLKYNYGDDFPESVLLKIDENIKNYLECTGKICRIGDLCEAESLPTKDVYVQSILLAATQDIYSLRQLVLFCWIKEGYRGKQNN